MNKIFKFGAITQREQILKSGRPISVSRGKSSPVAQASPGYSEESGKKIEMLYFEPDMKYLPCTLNTTYYFKDSLKVPEMDIVIEDILGILRNSIPDHRRYYRYTGSWRREPGNN